jgi:hypothetical protein
MEGRIEEMYDIKNRLANLNKTQVWLLRELRSRGVTIQPPQLANFINGVCTYPKATTVLGICNEILNDFESNVTKE